MSEATTVSQPARSPLDLPAPGGDPQAPAITDLAPLGKFLVRAPEKGALQAVLGAAFGSSTRPSAPLAGALVIGSGPGEWLVLSPPQDAARCRAELERAAGDAEEFTAVVDLTHGRALVRITGADTDALLAKVCAVDFADTVVPNGAAFRSSVARVVTDVARDDVDGTRSYLLHCERSSGQYLAGCLLDAGAEFGIRVDSGTAPGI